MGMKLELIQTEYKVRTKPCEDKGVCTNWTRVLWGNVNIEIVVHPMSGFCSFHSTSQTFLRNHNI